MKYIENFTDMLSEMLMAAGIYIFMTLGLSLVKLVPVYFLWNWLFPELFGLQMISVIQAYGICILVTVLLSCNGNSSD